MRRAARIDANHREIVTALRGVRSMVVDLSAVGRGVPDIAVLYRGVWHMIEIKDGAKSPSRRALTQAEQDWHAAARPYGGARCCHVVKDVGEALAAIGAAVKGGT